MELERGRNILKRLPDSQCSGVEIGVLRGRLSEYLLQRKSSLHLTLIDPWKTKEKTSVTWFEWEFYTKPMMEQCYQQTLTYVEPYKNRVNIMRMSSNEAAKALSDQQFDFVFLDAERTTPEMLSYLSEWWPLVKKNGWIGGTGMNEPALVRNVSDVVTHFAKTVKSKVISDTDFCWFIYKKDSMLKRYLGIK